MEKKVDSSCYKSIIDDITGKKNNKQKNSLSDISLEEMKSKEKTRKLLKNLSGWNADVDDLKEKAKIN